MRKIVITNRKGGVAKTTTAVHLAHGLALGNQRVLLIDTDPQGNCSKMLGISPRLGLADLLDGETAADCITEARPRLHVLAGTRSLAGIGRVIARADYGSEHTLGNALEVFDGAYDYVIMDTAPSFSELATNCYFYGDEIIVPVSMEVLAVEGLRQLIEEMQPVTKLTGIRIRYILPVMVDYRKALTGDIVGDLVGSFDGMIPGSIPYHAKMSEIPHTGKTIFEADPRSRAGIGYAEFVYEVMMNG